MDASTDKKVVEFATAHAMENGGRRRNYSKAVNRLVEQSFDGGRQIRHQLYGPLGAARLACDMLRSLTGNPDIIAEVDRIEKSLREANIYLAIPKN